MKRKHKTLKSAKAELNKNADNQLGHEIFKIKKAHVWKYWIGSYFEWLNK